MVTDKFVPVQLVFGKFVFTNCLMTDLLLEIPKEKSALLGIYDCQGTTVTFNSFGIRLAAKRAFIKMKQ